MKPISVEGREGTGDMLFEGVLEFSYLRQDFIGECDVIRTGFLSLVLLGGVFAVHAQGFVPVRLGEVHQVSLLALAGGDHCLAQDICNRVAELTEPLAEPEPAETWRDRPPLL